MITNAHLESRLEEFFRRRVRMLGGHTEKLIPTTRGMPDRLVLMPGGKIYLVELKAEGGRVRPAQQVWHGRAARLGSPVAVLTGRQEVLEWLARVTPDKEPQ